MPVPAAGRRGRRPLRSGIVKMRAPGKGRGVRHLRHLRRCYTQGRFVARRENALPRKKVSESSKKTFAFYGGMGYTCEDVRIRVCGCKSRPVAGETIHVSGQSPVSMVRLRGKTNRGTERGSSGEPVGLGANPPVGECGGKDQVSHTTGINKIPKGENTNVRRQSFDLQGLRP